MKEFILICWNHRKTRFTVEWDDTDRPYTKNGPRKTGTFKMTGYLRIWLWGQTFCFFKPRAAVTFGVEASVLDKP